LRVEGCELRVEGLGLRDEWVESAGLRVRGCRKEEANRIRDAMHLPRLSSASFRAQSISWYKTNIIDAR